MKDSSNTAKMLELPYAPEAEEYLDELERSGQFRVGIDAEVDEAEPADAAASNDYAWGRGSGNVCIQDWWTTGRVALHIGAGIPTADLKLSRVNDSLVLRTADGLDRLTLEGYLGLIPDASTLRIIFTDGSEWSGAELLAHVGTWLNEVPAATGGASPNH
jgi:hypothetical protein